MQHVALNPSSARMLKIEFLQILDETQNYMLQLSALKTSCAATTPVATIKPNLIPYPPSSPLLLHVPLPLSLPISFSSFQQLCHHPLPLSSIHLLLWWHPLRMQFPSLPLNLHLIFQISLQHLHMQSFHLH